MDEELKDNLIQYYHKSAKKEKFNTYFTKLTQPIRPSFTNDEAISLLKILKFIKERPDLLNVFLNSSNVLEKISSSIVLTILKEHRDNFHWVRCNYADGTESSLEYFVEEIRTMLKKETDPATILKEEDEKYRFNKNEKERIIKELKINDQKTLQMIRLSEQLLHFQDDRKKVILIILCSINKILYEIAKRYNLDTRLSLYLCAEEITEEIINKITNRQLQERKDGCIFLWKRTSQNKGKYDYETKVLVGKEFKDFVAILKEHDEEEINDFRGMCASTGTATGKVRICQTKDDLKKFEQGEVLITSMTRPEFVTAMKKAAAIVTDEGGITCHASIISRELKIPCVIGTKIATKVLKDGDFVEVRANHSLVKIIERVKQ
ncbi:hypothetical protein COY27_01035 [Candidatus Woesearchaeota archaeon CG_4_10_14_0_2_um_filter_33_13]|nr:MAG: hypothetical protein COY27_01035 [Candidatus Woesearchaeota archaeon CG_4_10_14_0_2_um_filter_33_13]